MGGLVDQIKEKIDKNKNQVFILCCPAYFPFNFFRHPWLVLNKKGVISRWEVRHSAHTGTKNHLFVNNQSPFEGINKSFFIKSKWKPKLLKKVEGELAEEIISFVENSKENYPYVYKYNGVGPNSNTYIQWILNKFSDIDLKLSWRFIGKKYINNQVDKYAKLIWDYMHVKQELSKSDIIFVLGSNDLRVADRATEIYKKGLAPIVICSGGNGKRSDFNEPEAKLFSERMISLGVPKEKILLEPKSSNTGENVIFTQKLIQENNIEIKKIIAVQKPYMERRTFATINKQWPEIQCVVTSPQISYKNYYNGNLTFKNRFINVMVGDLLRIKEYPKLGFQTEQHIPNQIWDAGQNLIKMGYNKYII